MISEMYNWKFVELTILGTIVGAANVYVQID